jgi:hypothetical protein
LFVLYFTGPLPTTTAGYKYVLTFTDYYTKFVDFYPLKDKTAGGVAHGIKTFVCKVIEFIFAVNKCDLLCSG